MGIEWLDVCTAWLLLVCWLVWVVSTLLAVTRQGNRDRVAGRYCMVVSAYRFTLLAPCNTVWMFQTPPLIPWYRIGGLPEWQLLQCIGRVPTTHDRRLWCLAQRWAMTGAARGSRGRLILILNLRRRVGNKLAKMFWRFEVRLNSGAVSRQSYPRSGKIISARLRDTLLDLLGCKRRIIVTSICLPRVT
jgi:hypothetical protein